MGKSSKVCIGVSKNGVLIGYVRSIRYENRKYRLTTNKDEAHGYDTMDAVFYDIDVITTPQTVNEGVIFTVEKKISDKEQIYEQKALLFAERYGILEYTVKGNLMIYLVSYPKYLGNPAYTVRFTVNLDTGKESSERLSRFYKKGLVNRG